MEKQQDKGIPELARAEYFEVETNVRLNISDAGTGRPFVLIHGWSESNHVDWSDRISRVPVSQIILTRE